MGIARNKDGLVSCPSKQTFEYLPIPEEVQQSSTKNIKALVNFNGNKVDAVDLEEEEDEGYGGSDTGSVVGTYMPVNGPRPYPSHSDAISLHNSREYGYISAQEINGQKQSRLGDSDGYRMDDNDDPLNAPFLPPLPQTYSSYDPDLRIPDSASTSFRRGATAGPSEVGTPTIIGVKLEQEQAAIQMEENIAMRREGRSQLDAYISEPTRYESSSLRYAHSVGAGGHISGRNRRRRSDQQPLLPPSIIPSILPQTLRAYSETIKEAKTPAASVSSRAYKEAAANVILHTTGYSAPFLLAAGTHQVPGRNVLSVTPKGSQYVGGHPVWASTGMSVNQAQAGVANAYPEEEMMGVDALRVTEPTLSRGLISSSVHADTTLPVLLRTLASELPGPNNPMAETSNFKKSSWLKPSFLQNSAKMLPPGPLRVDAARADEEGLKEGDLALYGEGIRAPGQPDPEGKAAKAAGEKRAKKLKEQAEKTGPKIKFTLGGGAGNATASSSSKSIDLTGPGAMNGTDQADEILLIPTWPLGDGRGDWQNLIDFPQGEVAASEMETLIAYGYGKRPISRAAPIAQEGQPPANLSINIDAISERLAGLVNYPRSKPRPRSPPTLPQPEGLSDRKGMTLSLGGPSTAMPLPSATVQTATPRITFRLPGGIAQPSPATPSSARLPTPTREVTTPLSEGVTSAYPALSSRTMTNYRADFQNGGTMAPPRAPSETRTGTPSAHMESSKTKIKLKIGGTHAAPAK